MDGYSTKFDFSPYLFSNNLEIEEGYPYEKKLKLDPIQNCYDRINKEFEKDNILSNKILKMEDILTTLVNETILSIKDLEGKVKYLEKNFKENKKEGFVFLIIRKLKERRAKNGMSNL